MAKGAIGDAYMELKDYDKGADYYSDAADYSKNSFTTPMFLMKAGMAYDELKNYEKALKYYKRIRQDYHQSDEAREINKYIAYDEALMNK